MLSETEKSNRCFKKSSNCKSGYLQAHQKDENFITMFFNNQQENGKNYIRKTNTQIKLAWPPALVGRAPKTRASASQLKGYLI